MKGPRELKIYVSRHRRHLKNCRWDDLMVLKSEKCKNWYKRNKLVSEEEMQDE